MKKLFLFSIIVSIVGTVSAQHIFSNWKIKKDDKNESIIHVNPGGLELKDIQTPIGIAKKVVLHKGSALLKSGAPDLSKLSLSIIVPNGKKGSLSIEESTYTDYPNVNIAPSKGNLKRSLNGSPINPSSIPFIFGEEYQKDAFFPSIEASISNPEVLRDFTGQTLTIFATQYNPVKKILRVYNYLKLKVSYEADPNAVLTNSERPSSVVDVFDGIYQNHFENYKTTGYTPLTQEGSMLVICPALYLNEIGPYLEWKQRKGIKTFLLNLDTLQGGANEANIHNTIKGYYQTHGIAYVLLVGDQGNITTRNPNFTSSFLLGPSDNAYGYILGTDHNPELIVGRLSGENVSDIRTQVSKSIQYEKAPYIGTNWYKAQAAVASEEGPGDDNQYDFQHLREIADSNINHYTYTSKFELYEGSQGGADAAGHPIQNDLINAFNNGIGLMNYCGHGGSDVFVTTGFNTGDVLQLTNNQGNWPLVFSTACVNGEFTNQTCLAEALLRAKDANNIPTGAVGALMSTINQSWDPPMEGQDEMNGIMRGHRLGNFKTTFGALAMNGCLQVNEKYNVSWDPNGGNEITDTWTVFGDPTLEIKTDHKGTLTATHPAEIGRYTNYFYVNSNEEGAAVGLYYKGAYLASGKIVGGKATMQGFNAVNDLDTVFITVTKQNFSPYFGYALVKEFPVGLQEVDATQVLIYPNPASQTFEIKGKGTIQSYTVRNLQGQIITKGNANKTKLSIDCKAWPNGLYEVLVDINGIRYQQKLVKQ